ncbi:hypothetical protein F5Y11DRAFT_338413 [Daldinia sp. FL1419]|nr:hypothetical protein F5Y11DRAFT_338413 [Daldinia sp. FL1419]
MISFQASYIRSKHNALLRTWAFSRPTNICSRSSSLSAIHRGLRNSEKARPQGFKRDSLNTARSNRTEKPSFKVQKGKKDITYKGPEPKSRAARFHDPNDSFGKKSLVYQLKSSSLRESSARPGGKGRFTRDERDGGLSKAQFMKDFRTSPGTGRERNTRAAWSTPERAPERQLNERGSRNSSHRPAYGERPHFESKSNRSHDPGGRWMQRGSNKSWKSTLESSRDERTTPQRPRAAFDSRPSVERQEAKEDEQASFHHNSSKDHGPIRIPRTTAASQFLYGYSTVEAVLKESRRRLYKLYIYNGEYRRDASRIIGMERKATQAGIPVTKLEDTAGLRMMDKMSDGRPHNGFVLEASPLPQLPVRALRELTEAPAPGFNLELAHQSAEEAWVNGTSNFVKCTLPPNRKPFVLLLDGIQDPGNLGAILRSASFLGVNAVGVTKGHSASLTPVAVKASAGASESMQLFSVSSVLDFLTKSKEAGWVVYAAVAPTGRPRESKNITLDRLDTYDPLASEPTILVVGSEGEGLEKKTRRLADFEISIPNHSASTIVESLNVSVATAILCSAFLKNQHTGGEFDKIIEVKDDGSDQLW